MQYARKSSGKTRKVLFLSAFVPKPNYTNWTVCAWGAWGGEGGGDVLVRVLMRVVDNRPRWVQATESFTTSFGVDMSVKESDCQRRSQADPLQS